MTIKKKTEKKNIEMKRKRADDPYSFFSGDVKVTMCFSDNGKTIEEQLTRYILAVKGI